MNVQTTNWDAGQIITYKNVKSCRTENLNNDRWLILTGTNIIEYDSIRKTTNHLGNTQDEWWIELGEQETIAIW